MPEDKKQQASTVAIEGAACGLGSKNPKQGRQMNGINATEGGHDLEVKGAASVAQLLQGGASVAIEHLPQVAALGSGEQHLRVWGTDDDVALPSSYVEDSEGHHHPSNDTFRYFHSDFY